MTDEEKNRLVDLFEKLSNHLNKHHQKYGRDYFPNIPSDSIGVNREYEGASVNPPQFSFYFISTPVGSLHGFDVFETPLLKPGIYVDKARRKIYVSCIYKFLFLVFPFDKALELSESFAIRKVNEHIESFIKAKLEVKEYIHTLKHTGCSFVPSFSGMCK